MRRRLLCMVATAAAPIIAFALPCAPAQATPGVLVYPGMEVRQGTNVCTLGFVDPQPRVAFTAGHCRGSGAVNDRDGNPVGTQAAFRDNTPDGRAAIVGMFNSTWGQYPAAVSWQVASQQAREDVISFAAGSVNAPPPAP